MEAIEINGTRYRNKQNGKYYAKYTCPFCNAIFEKRQDAKKNHCGCQSNEYKNRRIPDNSGYIPLEQISNQKKKIKCKCKTCGNIVKISSMQLFYPDRYHGCNKCKKQRMIKAYNEIGGLREHPGYNILDGMKQRCYNKKSKAYKYYGAKKIKICEEWMDKKSGYISFCKWLDENNYEPGLTIDRINPYGDYEPSNCRLVPKSKQGEYKRMQDNNKSGYPGVWFNSKLNKYETFITEQKHKQNIGYFTTIKQAYITRYMYILQNNINRVFNINEIDKRILEWGASRFLFKYNEQNEIDMLEEELKELSDAIKQNDMHEIIDAYADYYVIFTQTLGKAGLSKIDINESHNLWKYYETYNSIFSEIRKLGYDPEFVLNETIREIESREQDPEQYSRWQSGIIAAGEKWKKNKNQNPDTLYKADYDNAKIK
jgi:hypothetical protein